MCLPKKACVNLLRSVLQIFRRKRSNKQSIRSQSAKISHAMSAAEPRHNTESRSVPAQPHGSPTVKNEMPISLCPPSQRIGSPRRPDAFILRRSQSLPSGLDWQPLPSTVKLRRSASCSIFGPLNDSVVATQPKAAAPHSPPLQRAHTIPGVSSSPPNLDARLVRGTHVMHMVAASNTLEVPKQSTNSEKSCVPVPSTNCAVGTLMNIGNTCYLNAIVQVLRHIPELNNSIRYICTKNFLKNESILICKLSCNCA